MVATNVPVLKPGAIILSFAQVQWSRLSTIAGNLSNAHTPGFKELMLKAEEVPYSLKDGSSVSYVRVAQIVRNTQNGSLRVTGNPLDIALMGPGYLGVKTDNGPRYTRNGQLRVRADGVLVGASGHPILGLEGGDIQIPPGVNHLSISSNGTLSSETGAIGRIGVFRFQDEQALRDVGNSLYETTEEALAGEEVEVLAGTLEDSNVNEADATLQIMQTARLYEQAQTLSKADDERVKSILNLTPKAA